MWSYEFLFSCLDKLRFKSKVGKTFNTINAIWLQNLLLFYNMHQAQHYAIEEEADRVLAEEREAENNVGPGDAVRRQFGAQIRDVLREGMPPRNPRHRRV